MSERYRVIELLGKGAMGEVLRAEDVNLGREVALKRLGPDLADNARAARRFSLEARTTAGLEHPGIVPVHALETGPDGAVVYAMKLVRGRTLAAYIDEARALHDQGLPVDAGHSLGARLEVFLHVLDAMAYAHERGVLHRDLKPDNIMVGAFGEVHVMDWGLARPVGRRLESLPEESTNAGQILGTPAFMSPEQADGLTEQLDSRSDQFALGMLLQELVTLREARSARSLDEALRAAMGGRRNPVVHRDPKVVVKRELHAIIAKATAYRKDDRYPTVAAFADDVRRFLRDEPVLAEPDSPWQRLERWVGRHRTTALFGGLTIAVLAIALVSFVGWRSAVDARESDIAAKAREDRLQGTAALVGAQATRMNERLHDLESLLDAFAAVAARAMSEPAPAAPGAVRAYHYVDGHPEPADVPPTRASKVYGAPVSFAEPDYALATGVSEDAVAGRLAQLARLAPMLRRTLLESGPSDALALPPAAAEKLALDDGLPLVWVYMATEDGAAVGFPGSWSYEPLPGEHGYDPRVRRWYTEAPRAPHAAWLNSGVDENGLGLLVTCTRAIYDDHLRLLGVAAIDLTFAYVIERLLEEPRLARVGAETFIVDADGFVVVRSSDKASARDATRYKPLPFEHGAVLDARGARRSGHLALPDGRMAFWAPVESAGWTYVVVGAEAALLAP